MAREVADLLVKAVRLLANLAINPEIGKLLVTRKEIGCLVRLLQLKAVPKPKSKSKSLA